MPFLAIRNDQEIVSIRKSAPEWREIKRSDIPCYCPSCKAIMTPKGRGKKVVNHFAHLPDSNCEMAKPKGRAHRVVASTIYDGLGELGYEVKFEQVIGMRKKGHRRADIYIPPQPKCPSGYIIEVQFTKQDVEVYQSRTDYYNHYNLPVLWLTWHITKPIKLSLQIPQARIRCYDHNLQGYAMSQKGFIEENISLQLGTSIPVLNSDKSDIVYTLLYEDLIVFLNNVLSGAYKYTTKCVYNMAGRPHFCSDICRDIATEWAGPSWVRNRIKQQEAAQNKLNQQSLFGEADKSTIETEWVGTFESIRDR